MKKSKALKAYVSSYKKFISLKEKRRLLGVKENELLEKMDKQWSKLSQEDIDTITPMTSQEVCEL